MNPENQVIACAHCGAWTTAQVPVCLGCVLTAQGTAAPRVALALRATGRPVFRAQSLLLWQRERSGLLLSSFLERERIINKGCEQAQQEVQTVLERPDKYPGCDPTTPRMASEETATTEAQALRKQILTDLLTETGGLCTYCLRPCRNPVPDCVLPGGFKHTGVHPGVKLTYARVMRAAGLLRPACYACNFIKGWIEQQGSEMLRMIFAGTYKINPIAPGFAMSDGTVRSLMYYRGESLTTSNAKLTSQDIETLGAILFFFTLRLRVLCTCNWQRRFAHYDYQARTLDFECVNCCKRTGTAAFFVDRPDYLVAGKHKPKTT